MSNMYDLLTVALLASNLAATGIQSDLFESSNFEPQLALLYGIGEVGGLADTKTIDCEGIITVLIDCNADV